MFTLGLMIPSGCQDSDTDSEVGDRMGVVAGCLTWNSHVLSKMTDSGIDLVLHIFHHLSRETDKQLGF